MTRKSGTAKTMGGAMQGAGTGAAIGTAFAPGFGTAIGAGVGAIGGGIAGFLADEADEEALENDPEYQAAKRRERGAKLMSAALGRAFAAVRPKTMQGAVNRGI
jgi:uncharacterized protein YcfJ